jgi:NADH dehydrogenase FAD-containing subunit
MNRVVIAGCGFAGFSAAAGLKNLVATECDVEVISRQPLYVCSPALSAIPFDLRIYMRSRPPILSPIHSEGHFQCHASI